MQSIEITESQSISYEDYGQGPLILLLPGSLTTSKFWRPVGQRLSSDFRIITPNLPGFGGSDPRPPGIEPTTGYVSSCMETLLKFLGKPAVLCGHSYGGNVALDMAIRNQAPILGLALFEPVSTNVLLSIGKPEIYERNSAVFEKYLDDFMNGDRQAVKRVVDYWFGAGAFDNMPEPMQKYLIDHTAANVLDVQATYSQKISLKDLQVISIPVMAVCGSESHEAMIEVAGAVASAVQNGRFIKVDGADHGMVNMHPDFVAELITKFGNQCF